LAGATFGYAQVSKQNKTAKIESSQTTEVSENGMNDIDVCGDKAPISSLRLGCPIVTKTLKLGDFDPEVAALKTYLKITSSIGETHIFDANLEAKIKIMQKEMKVPQTGMTDEATRNAFDTVYFYNQYAIHKDKLVGSSLWNKVAALPVNLSIKERIDPADCNGTKRLPGYPTCIVAFTIKNTGKNPAPITSLTTHVSGMTDFVKVGSTSYIESKGAMSQPATVDARGNSLSTFDQLISLKPGESINVNLISTTPFDTIGSISFSVSNASTLFGDVMFSPQVSKEVTYQKAFPTNTPTVTNLPPSFSYRGIHSGTPFEAGKFLVSNTNNEDFSVARITFKVESLENIPYDQLFKDVTIIVSAVGYHENITIEKIDDRTFTVVAKNPVGIMKGAYVWYKLHITPIKPGTHFNIKLIDVKTINGTSIVGPSMDSGDFAID
jgi:hypothetical protein